MTEETNQEKTQVVAQAIDIEAITAIITNINSMYNNVIAYTFGLLAIVGVLIPLGINYFQRKQFNDDNKNLVTKIEKVSNKLQEEIKENKEILEKLSESTKKELHDEINVTKEKNRIDMLNMKAIVYSIQASDANPDKPVLCLMYSTISVSYAIQSNNTNQIEHISRIVQVLFICVEKDIFKKDLKTIEENLNELIKELNDNNKNNIYSMYINKIKDSFEKAKKRCN